MEALSSDTSPKEATSVIVVSDGSRPPGGNEFGFILAEPNAGGLSSNSCHRRLRASSAGPGRVEPSRDFGLDDEACKVVEVHLRIDEEIACSPDPGRSEVSAVAEATQLVCDAVGLGAGNDAAAVGGLFIEVVGSTPDDGLSQYPLASLPSNLCRTDVICEIKPSRG